MDARNNAPTASNDAVAGQQGKPENPAAHSKSRTRTAGSKAAGAVSVISGYRYYKRAGASLVRSAKMPYVQKSINDAKQQYKDLRSEPVMLESAELPDEIVRKSLLAHLLVLLIVAPAGIMAFYYFVSCLGLWVRHNHGITDGNFGLVSGLLFSLYALPRSYVSYKSWRFFSQVAKERNLSGYWPTVRERLLRLRGNKPVLTAAAAFTAVLMLGFAGTAMAADSFNTGNPEFDQHVMTLSQVGSTKDFGETMINWIAHGSPEGSRADHSLLSRVAFTLSGISLIIMVFLAGLGGLNFTIHTANKGIPGGQIISSFWMPIRVATATILLVPFPGGTGYSTLHYGVIEIAKSGSAYGSFMAGEILDYIGTNGVYQTTAPGGGTAVVHSLVLGELCRAYIHANEKLNPGDAGSIEIVVKNNKITYDRTKKGTTSRARSEFCGGLSFPEFNKSWGNTAKATNTPLNTNPIYEIITGSSGEDQADKQSTASHLVIAYIEKTVIPNARIIAGKLMNDQAALEQLKSSGGVNQSGFDQARRTADDSAAGVGHDIDKLVNEYNTQVQQILAAAALEASGKEWDKKGWFKTPEVGKWTDEIKETGWPAFGMIFWHASQHQKQINLITTKFKPNIILPIATDGYDKDERWQILQGRLSTAQKTAADITTGFDPDLSSLVVAGDLDGTRVLARAERFFTQWISSLIIPTSEDANMVTRLQSTGSKMMASVESLIFGYITAKATVESMKITSETMLDGAESAISGFPVLGKITGGVAKIVKGPAKGFVNWLYHVFKGILSYFIFLLIPILFAGFTLGVVLPAIPTMFWLLGVISYLLFFVQCLIVSTFWLAAHGTAEGQGWGSEHTRQGYLLMLGLFLNPVLRVAGFGAMLLVLMPVGVLTQWMMNYQLGIASTHGVATPLTLVGGLIITTVFAYSACVRIFALPSELYEHGLRWINGGQEVTGDSASEQGSRTFIAVATRGMTPGTSASGSPLPKIIPPGTEGGIGGKGGSPTATS